VILTDTGPLVALLDRRQRLHQKCREVFQTASLPLVTTWACFTEAMYFAQREGGHGFQHLLWAFVNDGVLRIYDPANANNADYAAGEFLSRMQALMEQYRDLPMDMADASVVAAAEQLNTRKIFTLDNRDFLIYRTAGGGSFDIIPG
jgi:uncharacterized protein